MPAPAMPLTDATRPSSHWTGWGQWLALITMTTDHLTRYVFPASWGLDWAGGTIGRIAFPLFAAMVAWHSLFNTRNPLRYARRILVIGIVAQFPYMLMPRASGVFVLNIGFTLAAGLLWGAWLRNLLERHHQRELNIAWLSVGIVASLVAWYLLGDWVEYGHNGLLLIPLYMLAIYQLNRAGETLSECLLAVAFALPVLIVAGQMNATDVAKSFTVATCLLVLLLAAGAARYVPPVGLKMPRQLWLSWYPGHFALIALWLWLTGGVGNFG